MNEKYIETPVSFFTPTDESFLPETIPQPVRKDMVDLPFPYLTHQKNADRVRYFKVDDLFPDYETTEDTVFLNTIILSSVLSYYNKQDSALYWINQTVDRERQYFSPWRDGNHIKVAGKPMNALISMSQQKPYVLTENIAEGAIPVSKAGVVRSPGEQLDELIQREAASGETDIYVPPFSYISRFTDVPEPRRRRSQRMRSPLPETSWLTPYANFEVDTESINHMFWSSIGHASTHNPLVLRGLSEARITNNDFPEPIRQLLRASGMTKESY